MSGEKQHPSLSSWPFSSSWISAAKTSVRVICHLQGAPCLTDVLVLVRFHSWSRVLSTPFLPLGGRGSSSSKAVLTSFILYVWLCWVFVAGRAFSSCSKQGLLSSCMGFSFQWLLLWRMGSRHAGLRSCDTQA